MTERMQINTAIIPSEVVVAHRETPSGMDVVELWYDEGDQNHTLRFLTEWEEPVVVWIDPRTQEQNGKVG